MLISLNYRYINVSHTLCAHAFGNYLYINYHHAGCDIANKPSLLYNSRYFYAYANFWEVPREVIIYINKSSPIVFVLIHKQFLK